MRLDLKRGLIVLAIILATAALVIEIKKSGTDEIQRINETEVLFDTKEIEARIVKEISRSKKTIDIAIFTLTSDRITAELKKSQEGGKEIRIIVPQRVGEFSNEKHGKVIEDLGRAGIKIKTIKRDGVMHHKFAIFDNKIILSGSRNWVSGRGYDNIIITSIPSVVDAYKNEFEKLWKEGQ